MDSFLLDFVEDFAYNLADCFERLGNSLLSWDENPQDFFLTSLMVLTLITALMKALRFLSESMKDELVSEAAFKEKKPQNIAKLQRIYLPVFWLLRMAFWMSGAYFYPVYASKTIDGNPLSADLISLIFMVGFISAAVLSPLIGRAADYFGRKKATIFASLLYALGALSTKSRKLWVLVAGRAVGGMGTALITMLPEAWLCSETQKTEEDPYRRWLAETLGAAYSMDSIVAIFAGQFSAYIAADRGPVGPFEFCPYLVIGAVSIICTFWNENVAEIQDLKKKQSAPSIYDSISVAMADRKILMVGMISSTFEAAMYLFVMNWAPLLTVATRNRFGESCNTPYGAAFTCFMASCLVGSTLFTHLSSLEVRREKSATVVMSIAGASLAYVANITCRDDDKLIHLSVAFFVYEACVGMYFPTIGWLRSKYIPDSHRAGIVSLFTMVFNGLVVIISLTLQKIGSNSAWATCALLLLVPVLCLVELQRVARREAVENLPRVWARAKQKWIAISRILKIRKIVSSRMRNIKEKAQ